MSSKLSEKRREYLRKYNRLWIRKRKREYFADKSCVKCGSEENLEIDHIDRTKKWTHRFWSYRKEIREAELKKCQILCWKCHDIKTVNECYGGRKEHGISAYRHRKCRCEICSKAQKDYCRKYREKMRGYSDN